jgi:hypothetical protein
MGELFNWFSVCKLYFISDVLDESGETVMDP